MKEVKTLESVSADLNAEKTKKRIENNKIKRLVIMELVVPIGGKSKHRARQSIYQILDVYKDILSFESDEVTLKTLTMPIKTEDFHGPFLTVVFDSNKDYECEEIESILKRVDSFNRNFLEEIKKLDRT